MVYGYIFGVGDRSAQRLKSAQRTALSRCPKQLILVQILTTSMYPDAQVCVFLFLLDACM